ncbi:MAG TPA: ABC transporter ATP-binding protein [Pseudonocardiaceae bacterium]|jgi:ABC-type glutathione transport system ATPase component|nr:ABC transporter ATP-binding protein [Pseudonocardiaceae bacterium]
MSLLEITDLTVRFGAKTVLDQVNLTVEPGERVGLIGESGSGKSLTALAAIGLLPDEAAAGGSVQVAGTELLGLRDRDFTGIRGEQVAMVFQEPLSALNPLMRVGKQIAEPLRLHRGLSRSKALAEAIDLARRVGLPDPADTVRAYPHQLSGGQRQRVGIAMALACKPGLLIADEPTTALDVTVQAEILDLLGKLVADQGSALLFITHDLAVLAKVVERVVVLSNGEVVETAPLEDILHDPQHEYTRELLRVARAETFLPPEVTT